MSVLRRKNVTMISKIADWRLPLVCSSWFFLRFGEAFGFRVHKGPGRPIAKRDCRDSLAYQTLGSNVYQRLRQLVCPSLGFGSSVRR